MTQRAITVLLNAVTGPYEAAMGRAATKTQAFGAQASAAGKAASSKVAPALGQLSNAMLGGSGVLFAAAATGKSLMDYEDALVGVGKTTGLTGDALYALGDNITGLALRLEGSAEEMLGISQIAAQLGVSGTKNIETFTEVIAGMASATDLTAEAAATDMARLSNIMGLPIGEVERLGSTIVQMGNTMATTEPEVLNLATRLAAAGRNADMTAADVVGTAAAMSQLGVEAEAGGTAMSMAWNDISKIVSTGSDDIEAFAEVAGVSAQQFATMWGEDAAGAFTLLVEGLERVKNSGGSVNAVLSELGFEGARQQDVMLRLASDTEGLAEALDSANDAYADNTALAEEVETANARASVAVENLSDAFGDLVRAAAGDESGTSTIAAGAQHLQSEVEAATTEVEYLRWLFTTAPWDWKRMPTWEDEIAGTEYYASAVEELGIIAGQTAEQVDDYAVAVEETISPQQRSAEAAAQLYEQNQALADQMLAAVDPTFAFLQAQQDVADAAEALTDALEAEEMSLDDVTAAELELLDAQLRLDASALTLGGSIGSATAEVDRLEESGRITAETADRLRDRLDAARDSAEQLEGDYRVSLFFDAYTADARAEIDAISKLTGVRIGGAGALARGGPMDPGRWYLTGESGPELVYGGQSGGQVIDAQTTAAMLSPATGSAAASDQRTFRFEQTIVGDVPDELMFRGRSAQQRLHRAVA